jgi:hypothetical protein
MIAGIVASNASIATPRPAMFVADVGAARIRRRCAQPRFLPSSSPTVIDRPCVAFVHAKRGGPRVHAL